MKVVSNVNPDLCSKDSTPTRLLAGIKPFKAVLLTMFLSLFLCGCPTEVTDTPDTSNDVSTKTDMGTKDATSKDDTTSKEDTTPDPDVSDDAGEDGEVAELLIEDQTLEAPFNSLVIRSAILPESATEKGTLRIRFSGGESDGEEAGSIEIDFATPSVDLPLPLIESVVGAQFFVADIVDSNDKPYMDINGGVLEVTFTVIGDSTDPELIVESQSINPANLNNLKDLNISRVVVPDRFTVGAWLVVYEDDNGALGAIRGKQKYLPGEHLDTVFSATSNFIKKDGLHALLRTPRPGSGSWDSNGPIIETLSGVEVRTVFELDGLPYQANLEVEDQEVPAVNIGFSKLMIKLATVPLEYLGGGWVGIYDDNAGSPGAFIGNAFFRKGTHDDVEITLNTNLQGDQVLHAKIFGGQRWADAEINPLKAPDGRDIVVSFRTGALSLSYIDAAPYTTDNPRYVVVKRAYSFEHQAWITLSRDNNGVPGTLIAKKRILPKFAGTVNFTSTAGNFEGSGTGREYITGQPGTYRRAARGVDTLHVQMYEDNPKDNVFTYFSSGGTEDLPVLDANNAPVTEVMTVTVDASIKNEQKDSSRYYLPCPLSQHVDNATSLPVDCRCHVSITGLDFPECKYTLAIGLNMSFGAGPRASTLNFGKFLSGFTEPTELIAIATWKDYETVWPENSITLDVGVVMGIDVETRERRIIGGRYKGTNGVIQDYGTGPVLSKPFEIQKGPDGMYYIANYSYVRIGNSLTPGVDIIKMDPATGNREYVWRSNHLGYNLDKKPNPYGHCGNGRTEKYGYYSVQFGRKAFGIDDDGNFYLSYAHNGGTPTSNGFGIAKIGKDGSTCDIVTSSGVGADNLIYQGQNVGTGPIPQVGPYKGMLVKDGKLFTSTQLNGELYEIDIATGNRTVLHTKGVHDNNTGSTGTHIVWDEYRGLIWQGGFANPILMFDPIAGTSEPLWCPQNYRNYRGISCQKQAAWGNNGLLLERGFWMHPSRGDYIFVVNGPMIMRVDLTAGTSEIFSL